MAKQTFTTGQVLTAAQMTSLQQTAMLGGDASAKVASYVLAAADAGTAITMSNGSATTITVNTGLFAAGDIVTIVNLGAGVCTITAGTATVATSGSLALAQNQGGVLRFTSASAAIFFQFATPASGDIEGVTAGTGISGGGTSGTVTITNAMATEIDAKGDLVPGTGADSFARLAVGANETRLVADSAQSTGLKYVADTTNYAIAAKGDLLVGTAADTLAALTVGTNGFTLVADSSTATGVKWAAPETGDITAVTAGTGISGGGTSGAVTITNSMATEITASGDIIVGTGSGTFDNLPIGTTGQVLTADTTVSPYKVKWAAASAPSFVGCAAFASANQSISNSTVTTLTFNSEKFDTNGFHDNVTNTGRFTIPANYGGYYECSLLFAFEANGTGYRRAEIWKNGSKIYGTDGNGNNQGSTDTKPINAIVNLVATDYIEFRVIHNSGGTLTGYTTDQYCQASIRYLGA